jgi:hypothetical protein
VLQRTLAVSLFTLLPAAWIPQKKPQLPHGLGLRDKIRNPGLTRPVKFLSLSFSFITKI